MSGSVTSGPGGDVRPNAQFARKRTWFGRFMERQARQPVRHLLLEVFEARESSNGHADRQGAIRRSQIQRHTWGQRSFLLRILADGPLTTPPIGSPGERLGRPAVLQWDPFLENGAGSQREQFIIPRFGGRTRRKESSYVKQETIPSRIGIRIVAEYCRACARRGRGRGRWRRWCWWGRCW
jgi:hypothetical protein